MAKRLGRSVRGFKKADWETVSYRVMEIVCKLKYVQNPGIGDYLNSTIGYSLAEACLHDTRWANGLHISDVKCSDPKEWRGLCLLGAVLESVRSWLLTADSLDVSPIIVSNELRGGLCFCF